MREIKFRAWDGYHMIDPFCELRGSRFWGEDLTNTKYFEPIAIMQYTGLKDRNGKEIYEGDIVNISYMLSGVRGYIRYSKSKAAFILCDKNKETVTTLGNMTLDKDRFHHPKTCEVIGNIHETAGLLEK